MMLKDKDIFWIPDSNEIQMLNRIVALPKMVELINRSRRVIFSINGLRIFIKGNNESIAVLKSIDFIMVRLHLHDDQNYDLYIPHISSSYNYETPNQIPDNSDILFSIRMDDGVKLSSIWNNDTKDINETKTKKGEQIISLDVESNGLYGTGFAVGSCVIENGIVIDSFSGWVPSINITDEWVINNVIGNINHFYEYDSLESLYQAFWIFWHKYPDATFVCDVPFPVESEFIRKCVINNAKTQFDSPYPIIDVASVLFDHGIDPDINRREFCDRKDLIEHNPLHDSLASALTLIKVMKNKEEK